MSEIKGLSDCEGYEYEEGPDVIFEAPFSKHFFIGRMQKLSIPNGFLSYGELSVDFFRSSQRVYVKKTVRLQLTRARPSYNLSQALKTVFGFSTHFLSFDYVRVGISHF